MEQNRIRVLLVDDHAVVRRGLAAMIEPEPDMEVIGSAATGRDALALFREKAPDVTIMDLNLTAEMSGLEAIRAIRRDSPEARIIVLSAYKGDEDIFRALESGAATYLLKDTLGDDLVPVIRQVQAGKAPILPEVGRKIADRIQQPALTPREAEVLELVAAGLRNREIGSALYISEDTVQVHIRNLLSKLGANDRAEAVAIAVRRGILHLG